ncbi:hypothetical protein O2K51_09295 [Apibacter raozihei]|uniref:hypothetical protein n=1 Tax=Apibacter raozihei TaxID=2500547 RepID=UPI000FE42E9D|nr:hypothetical protein [Apibacter raozihei]
MKKLIIAAFAFFSVMSVQAQQGSIFLGTDLSYQRVDGFNNAKTNQVSFSPNIAYGIADNWYIGARSTMSFSENSAKTDMGGTLVKIKDKTYETKIGGFIRYNHSFTDTFGIFADLGAGYQQYRSDRTLRDYSTGLNYSDDTQRVRGSGYYINFVPSLFINFKNNFGLNVAFGGVEWNDTKTNTARDYANNYKSQSIDFTFGKSISVGVIKKFTF